MSSVMHDELMLGYPTLRRELQHVLLARRIDHVGAQTALAHDVTVLHGVARAQQHLSLAHHTHPPDVFLTKFTEHDGSESTDQGAQPWCAFALQLAPSERLNGSALGDPIGFVDVALGLICVTSAGPAFCPCLVSLGLAGFSSQARSGRMRPSIQCMRVMMGSEKRTSSGVGTTAKHIQGSVADDQEPAPQPTFTRSQHYSVSARLSTAQIDRSGLRDVLNVFLAVKGPSQKIHDLHVIGFVQL
jgi:hypothetical protein